MHWIIQNNIFSETGWDTLVELNTLNAVGFYAADVQKLVLVLEETFTAR